MYPSNYQFPICCLHVVLYIIAASGSPLHAAAEGAGLAAGKRGVSATPTWVPRPCAPTHHGWQHTPGGGLSQCTRPQRIRVAAATAHKPHDAPRGAALYATTDAVVRADPTGTPLRSPFDKPSKPHRPRPQLKPRLYP